MPKIERAGRAKFKGITGPGNMVEVQFGATEYQSLHGGWFKVAQGGGILFKCLEKLTVADEGDLDSFDVASSLVARGKGGQQLEIVDHGERRREGADEVFFAKGIDPIFNANAGVRLAEGGRRYSDVPHPAMGRGSRKSD